MSYARLVDPPPLSSSPQPLSQSIPMKSFFLRPSEPGRERAPVTPTRRRKLLLSYLPDWILTIALAAIFFSLDKVDGFRREFSLEETSIRHPYAVQERVPNIALYFICFVAPFLLMPIINLITIQSWWDLHNSTLGLILGLSMTGSITQFVKITVGRPRPDLIDRCQPPAGSVDPPFKLTSSSICTQMDPKILQDGFRSFFSGHSSMSFAGLGFLAFYLAGKLHLFDRRGHAGKAWLALSPFAGASLVAISRTMDYRHHWQDVLIGGIVGTFVTYFTYRQYYPSLASELSHRPYSPRIKREEPALPMHHQHANGSGVLHPAEPQPFKVQPSSQGYSQQQQGYNNPFTSPPTHTNELHPERHPSNHGLGRYADHSRDSSQDYELEGTVLRPGLPLDQVWKDGDGEVSTPRQIPPALQSRTGSKQGSTTHERSNTTA
ncbi:phosphatidic acid phosphatase type 2/haloperoxidase [Collybia nuda]|uniref:Phosphatidic acid phosphatase type 2/haloperoxidase n=1 Tax=Collybia nuda TaxID=64659 RepID=A0A9P6CHE9_9AGAR|nr:phosphatidic acid phosphatase type 2/haloperoxidase [Collybia nuda]